MGFFDNTPRKTAIIATPETLIGLELHMTTLAIPGSGVSTVTAPAPSAPATPIKDAGAVGSASATTVNPSPAPELPAANGLGAAMNGDNASVTKLTGRSPAIMGPPPSADKKAELGQKLSEAFVQAMSHEKLSSEFTTINELWRKHKTDRTARIWAARPEMAQQAVGAARWVACESVGYVSRGILQNIDVGAWENYLSRQGLIDLDDNWLRLVELVSFYLEVGRDEDDIADEHLDGGTLIQTGNFWALQALTPQEREKMGAIVSCSGPHMYQDEGIPEYPDGVARSQIFVDIASEPEKAKAKIRSRHNAKMAWLDDPKELQQFRDALFLVKLADRSRGKAYGKSDLSRVEPFTSDWARRALAVRKAS
jgi:hypothetical protein